MKRILAMIVLLSAMFSPYPAAAAQVTSNAPTIALSMNVGEAITLTPSVSTLPAFSYVAGASTSGSQTFTITASWQLSAGHVGLFTDFWLSSATAALTNGTTNIPASSVLLQINGTVSAMDCGRPANRAPEVSGATCNQGVHYPVTTSTNLSGSQTDSVAVSLASLLPNITAGAYTGTLNMIAYTT